MELIKDLPEVFEEFAEQRKNSFLALKKIKDQGTPVVGSYCTYFPREIAMAMGKGSAKEFMSIDQIQLRIRSNRQVSFLLLLRCSSRRDHL